MTRVLSTFRRTLETTLGLKSSHRCSRVWDVVAAENCTTRRPLPLPVEYLANRAHVTTAALVVERRQIEQPEHHASYESSRTLAISFGALLNASLNITKHSKKRATLFGRL